MTDEPLVSVITPSWQRHSTLLGRCVPSVKAQQWPCEHVIVSDGPDQVLAAIDWPAHIKYSELPGHDPKRHWGHLARLRGLELARGEFIAYLDDDDCWEPRHLEVLAKALINEPDAGFGFSRALVHMTSGVVRIGDGRPAHGRVQSSMLMHRRWVLKTATWEQAHPAEDWLLVQSWLEAGIPYTSAGEVTVHHYPSVPLDPAECVLATGPPPEVKTT